MTKPQTIGAVCKALRMEFPDISVSKIRYLEDQDLLTPRRTSGGYRLYAPGDVDRLRTILRLQRDEFLPLRVIRQELAAGRGGGQVPAAPRASDGAPGPRQRSVVAISEPQATYPLDDLCQITGADGRLVSELETYGVIRGSSGNGTRLYDETEKEILRTVVELTHYGVGARNLRLFRTSADREASLLQQILAPALRSRNPERRAEALRSLENLAAAATYLKHLLLVRDLRQIAS
jgi:DNA-binding transcriptional MerR regulator